MSEKGKYNKKQTLSFKVDWYFLTQTKADSLAILSANIWNDVASLLAIVGSTVRTSMDGDKMLKI